jgi:putative flippase GtrA
MQQEEKTAPTGTGTQTLRFLLTGGMAGLVDISIFALLAHPLGLHPLAANLVSRPIGGIVSFLGHKHWTFEKGSPEHTHRQAVRFMALWIALYFGSEALVGLYHNILHLPPVPTKLAAEGTLGVISFLYHKLFTFAK